MACETERQAHQEVQERCRALLDSSRRKRKFLTILKRRNKNCCRKQRSVSSCGEESCLAPPRRFLSNRLFLMLCPSRQELVKFCGMKMRKPDWAVSDTTFQDLPPAGTCAAHAKGDRGRCRGEAIERGWLCVNRQELGHRVQVGTVHVRKVRARALLLFSFTFGRGLGLGLVFFARVEPPYVQEMHRSACAVFG